MVNRLEIAWENSSTLLNKNSSPGWRKSQKTVPQQAIKNLDKAFKNFFRRVKAGEKPGYPKFKKKGISKDSFRPDNGSGKDKDALKIQGKKVYISKLGWVRLAEPLRFEGKIIGSKISRTADRWFISIIVDTEFAPHVRKNHGSCGIDLGVSTLATLDNGSRYYGARALHKLEDTLKRYQRRLSRKVKGSNNRKKAALKVARLYYRINCARKDAIHKATIEIVLNNDTIAMEDLNVKGMVKNHKLSKAISDASMSEFHRQILYKAKWYGSKVLHVDRFFPSTKLCMECGAVHEMTLSKRIFTCCGVAEDRDVHAAKNIIRQALSDFKSVESEALAA